ncbi:MAG: phosphoribosylanthranilate isomerase [Alphaproteobacteria bacterium]|nr:phosphoribosylanthranilate isomerase [Alphaproteobacteria bacterium]
MARVKICGIRTPDDYAAVARAGADWVGMVFFPKSPRHLSLAEAAEIRALADANTSLKAPLLVALVVDADDDALDAMMAAARPEVIQCHGNETPERLAAIKSRHKVAVMKAIRVKSEDSLTAALAYDGIADMMLFDSAPVDAALPGGTGHSFDWGMMHHYRGTTPWMLAGGLTPANVAEAIRISDALAVDVSSGVESAPGKKDHQAIQDFVSAAQ